MAQYAFEEDDRFHLCVMLNNQTLQQVVEVELWLDPS